MSDDSDDRTASLMTPARLAQLKLRPRPPASSAAWLDQLASDAGSGHIRRLIDLGQQLQAQVAGRDYRSLAAACQALYDALERVDFAQVQPRGWLARATGKGREAAVAFGVQADRAVRAGDAFAEHVRALHKAQQEQGSSVERTLVEFDVEVRAIEKIMDQGARWLQDMRNQLKARQAAGGDPAAQQQIAEDGARCELLVSRLKNLRAASSAAQQAVERCKAATTRRVALSGRFQQVIDEECKAWQQKLSPVVDLAVATGAATQGVEDAQRAREALQAALKQAAQDASTLQGHEQTLADEVAALREPLQAAA